MGNISERDELLALVAENYYQKNKKQAEIAEMIGVTRSAISRMLSEAREKGIVEIIIHRPFQFDHDLEEQLQQNFNLRHIAVVVFRNQPNLEVVKKQLGKAASWMISRLIKPGYKIGISWGTSVQATIEAYNPEPINRAQVIQLVGVLGSTRHSYSSQILVEHLAQKIGGEGKYLFAPFIVENEEATATLLKDPFIQKAIKLGEKCDLALMGIGSTKAANCSLLQEKHITSRKLEKIQTTGAVGDVGGLFFDLEGNLAQVDFHQHRIGISLSGLLKIPTRLGIAGGIEKAEAVFGAICGGLVNSLVTDNLTALRVLELTEDNC